MKKTGIDSSTNKINKKKLMIILSVILSLIIVGIFKLSANKDNNGQGSDLDNEKIVENFKTIFDAILKAKPAAAKGIYMKNVAITSTMGPGIKINTETV